MPQKLNSEKAKTLPIEKIELDEKTFDWMLCEDPMGNEKLYEGIRNFPKDAAKLKKTSIARLSTIVGAKKINFYPLRPHSSHLCLDKGSNNP